MRSIFLIVLAFSCASSAMASPFDSQKGVRSLASSIRTIRAVKEGGGGSTGTAWALTDKHMVTAAHVCLLHYKDHKLSVHTSNKEYVLTPTAIDVRHDICVVKVVEGSLPFKPLKVRKAPLLMGEVIYTYGSPHGVPHILTKGWVAGSFETDTRAYRVYSLRATNGNSGSPVMDKEGHVVGVLVAVFVSYDQLSLGAPHLTLRNITKGPLNK